MELTPTKVSKLCPTISSYVQGFWGLSAIFLAPIAPFFMVFPLLLLALSSIQQPLSRKLPLCSVQAVFFQDGICRTFQSAPRSWTSWESGSPVWVKPDWCLFQRYCYWRARYPIVLWGEWPCRTGIQAESSQCSSGQSSYCLRRQE